MLTEERHVRQERNAGFRRWFSDQDFDLIIWYKPDQTIHGFQLCYYHAGPEKALTWRDDSGFSHEGVDSGEDNPMHNRSPLLVPICERFQTARLLCRFRAADRRLPTELRLLVRRKIREYGRLQKPRN